ncbi:MAG: hypothetical protein IT175_06175 [Acidobacteria bacterium]|nr:hypothetical protein [Acidobacteriota bacterium]
MAITYTRARADWQDDEAGGTPITAANLDTIEAGIAAAYTVVPGVATSTAGLPANPGDGQPHMIRAGSTPYSFIGLVWDNTYAKWVQPNPVCVLTEIGAPTTASASFVALSTSSFLYPTIFDFKSLYGAGLRLEFALIVFLTTTNGAETVTFAISGDVYDDADATAATVFTDELQTSHTGNTTTTPQRTLWTLPTYTAPTKAHLLLTPRGKVSGGATGTFRNASVWARWVSS